MAGRRQRQAGRDAEAWEATLRNFNFISRQYRKHVFKAESVHFRDGAFWLLCGDGSEVQGCK